MRNNISKQEYRYCKKKLGRLLLDMVSYYRCCQRNRRRSLTTDSDGRILLPTADVTCG